MLTLTSLNTCFNDAIKAESKYIAVKINLGLPKAEIIINPIDNFKDKQDYYNITYDEILCHRFAKNEVIQIIGFTHGNSFAEIENNLEFMTDESFIVKL
ncbi:hypothetical protein [Bacillus paranthracis]|uniref:hypothetical protein n=1 Tax=Bacillus paranthracis TaxID=2026186 RepID=UPI002D764EB2|nr:hypothetical protein [Bacillus paranthracis]